MPILDHFTDIFFFNFIMTHSKYKEKALTPPKKSRTTLYSPPENAKRKNPVIQII